MRMVLSISISAEAEAKLKAKAAAAGVDVETYASFDIFELLASPLQVAQRHQRANFQRIRTERHDRGRAV